MKKNANFLYWVVQTLSFRPQNGWVLLSVHNRLPLELWFTIFTIFSLKPLWRFPCSIRGGSWTKVCETLELPPIHTDIEELKVVAKSYFRNTSIHDVPPRSFLKLPHPYKPWGALTFGAQGCRKKLFSKPIQVERKNTIGDPPSPQNKSLNMAIFGVIFFLLLT